MRDDGVGLPLSRRVPGAARPGPGQSVQAALPEDLLTRMQAAVDAENAQADVHNHGEPNTEPLPCVTESGATSKAARRPASQTGIGPGIEAPPDQVAESAFAAPPPLEELPLRVAKALRAAPVAEDLRADEPEPVLAAESQPPAEAAYPPPAEPPRRTRPAAAAYDNQPSPGSIGWLWHEETTTARGSSSRRQPRAGWGGGSGHHTTALAVLGAVVLGAAGLIIGLSLHSASGAANGNSAAKTSAKPATTAPNPVTSNPAGVLPGGPPVAANRAAAVAWLAGEVAAATVVACDAPTCATLTANGFPPGQEVHLGLDSQTLSNAGVVIVTPQVRLLLGTVRPRLGSDVVPAVLASFGSGPGQVTIQVVDPSGASAYEAALSQDVQERMQLGNKLLDSGSITASPAAETELAHGQVDSRVLLAIQALIKQEPVEIVSFAHRGPHAGPGFPFRAVNLSTSDPNAGLSGGSYLQALAAVLRAHADFPAPSVRPAILNNGERVAHIQYSAPSPLGLLRS